MDCIEEIVRDYSKRVNNGRSIKDAFNHMWSEAHELDAEVAKVMCGHDEGVDGIVGEAIDVISCALDVIYLYKPDITNEELRAVMIKKMEKWLTLYGNQTK